MKRLRRLATVAVAVGLVTSAIAAPPAPAQADGDDSPLVPDVTFGIEAKAHFRDSDETSFALDFPFDPADLPPGFTPALATVDPGTHFEISVVTLLVDATWGDAVTAHLKLDVIDLYDRNPTSTDREVDADELWLRFGRESEPAMLPDGWGAYLKIGKFGKAERQDDRHLESYGLVSTAFNRFEDAGVELGVDLGRHVYVKLSATQGNPLFMRDTNALAGDNGTDRTLEPISDPPVLGSGLPILYDAEVEGLDTDGDLELGGGLGFRFGGGGGPEADLFLFGYERELAETVELEGTRYGGDLDLLRGPFDMFPLAISGNTKEEYGGNLWLYWGGFSAFAQYVDQEIAGLPRSGAELELAWGFELPLRWALAQRQLFPFVAPAVRYSELDNDFANPPVTPAPSFAWDWEKLDVGVRLGVIEGIDVTAEYAANTFVLASGEERDHDEVLFTLRWRR